ncbi:MAG: cytochrome c-type biogenesis protein CcmH [Alphaproteobacteria bacterium]|nr:cytochrome c-type biogenesis protein CcmH [Alphaproteobacteria bacterium]MBM3651629.1 cytochrome c-type biogenesis protein CcmH [Alphaproteobacteria bacterium]
MSVEAPSQSLPRLRGRGDPNDRHFSGPEGSPSLTPSPAKRGRVGVGVLIVCLLFPVAAHAVTPGERLADPALEARARTITQELRCLVCQNQSIDDSDASLAKDLRVLVREKLKEGMSDAEVREYVHSRYGDFVLLRPPMKPGTLLLWSAPLIALLAGAAAVWMAARRRSSFAAAPAKALSEEERARLKALGVSDCD